MTAPFTVLADWLAYLESLHPTTIELGLVRVATVRERLKLSPDCPVIIVGGTNGKGSVCAMLEAILHAAGYRVGCYTSPHLLNYNERVRIGKQPVSDAELCAAFASVEAGRGEVSLTYFEFGTLAAMQCFTRHRVDVAILEVGLGGRLDAVNVFDADCAVVTSVDLDHTDYLGDNREAIAFEKAGIFRPGRVAVFGDPDMPAAIGERAAAIGARLWRLGRDFGFVRQTVSGGEGQWDFQSEQGVRCALPLPALRGAYQLNNASSVLAALAALQDALPVAQAAVRRGLVEVELSGRFQRLPGKPELIVDVAHNPHAARALADNLAALPPASRTFAVFAMLKDKDRRGVVAALNAQIDVWLVAGIAAPRGATAAELAQILREAGVDGRVETFTDAASALRHACNTAGENDRIAAFGSFYTVAEVLQARGAHLA